VSLCYEGNLQEATPEEEQHPVHEV